MTQENLKNSLTPAIQELERFYFFLNKRFKLGLKDQVVITVQTKGRKKNAVGWFVPEQWNNSDGTVCEINLTAEDLKRHNPYETLCHEIAHFSNNQNKIKDCSVNQYHNKKFKELAEKLLLKVEKDKRFGFGVTSPTPAFEEMVKSEFKQQADAFGVFRSMKASTKQPTKMLKWECDCQIIRSSKEELDIKCLACGQKFERG